MLFSQPLAQVYYLNIIFKGTLHRPHLWCVQAVLGPPLVLSI